jgi:opacity protein-like surface antigen
MVSVRSVGAVCLFLSSAPLLLAQAKYTAKRSGDFQVGLDYVGGQSDYAPNLRGVGLYTTFDFTPHWGAEFDLHQADIKGSKIYERSYEIGGRYHREYGRFAPYAKAMVGRGVFNFAQGNTTYANLAYNMFTLGGGVDVRITRYLNVRGDYEYQNWRGFPPNGLTPQLVSVGVAYHFPGGLKRGQHY